MARELATTSAPNRGGLRAKSTLAKAAAAPSPGDIVSEFVAHGDTRFEIHPIKLAGRTGFIAVRIARQKLSAGSKVNPAVKAPSGGAKPVKMSTSRDEHEIEAATSARPQKPYPWGQSDFVESSRARALLRGIGRGKLDLESSGGALSLEQMRTILKGVSRQSVEKRVRDGSLLAVPGPGNRRVYPAAQFLDDGSIVPGLREVLAALPTRNGFATLNFLVRPDARLDGRRPIDVLKAGGLSLVLQAASAMGEPGA